MEKLNSLVIEDTQKVLVNLPPASLQIWERKHWGKTISQILEEYKKEEKYPKLYTWYHSHPRIIDLILFVIGGIFCLLGSVMGKAYIDPTIGNGVGSYSGLIVSIIILFCNSLYRDKMQATKVKVGKHKKELEEKLDYFLWEIEKLNPIVAPFIRFDQLTADSINERIDSSAQLIVEMEYKLENMRKDERISASDIKSYIEQTDHVRRQFSEIYFAASNFGIVSGNKKQIYEKAGKSFRRSVADRK